MQFEKKTFFLTCFFHIKNLASKKKTLKKFFFFFFFEIATHLKEITAQVLPVMQFEKKHLCF